MAPTSAAGGERAFGWAPTDDPGQLGGPSAAAIYGAGRAWTAAGFASMGHVVTVNPTTGALSISVVERSAPYHAGAFRVTRGYDAQEQYAQSDYLRTHPNTDPRPHFFGNWALDEEAQVSATWDRAYAEVLIGSGSGASLAYRSGSDFRVHLSSGAEAEERLRAFGVPGRTLEALGWRFEPGDMLLKSRQGSLSLVSGRFEPETLIDPAEVELWRFEPATGLGEHYTSAYAYQQLIDTDGRRETNPAVVRTLVTDALGHSISFAPDDAAPPYRTWALEDGAGRRYRLELEHALGYLDGNAPGTLAKAYLATQLIDESAPGATAIQYVYDDAGRLVTVDYPGQAGGAPRRYAYAYDDRGVLASIADPVGDTLEFAYVEDDVDVDARLLPRLKVAQIADGEGNRIAYEYDLAAGVTRVTLSGVGGDVRHVEIAYLEDTTDTRQRYVTRQTVDVTLGPSAPQSIVTRSQYSDDGRFLVEHAIDPLGNATSFEYNAYNQTTAVTDALGHRREMTYDVSSAPAAAAPNRYDLLRTFENSVDVDGAPYGVETRFAYALYDGDSSSDPADAAQSTHRLATRTNALGNVARQDYDDPQDHLPLRPSRLTDELGNVSTRSYDDRGAVLSETDAAGSTWSWSYDEGGRLLVTADPNGHAHHWQYDPSTGWLLIATDALGAAGDPAHSIRYEWNDAGQRVRETDAVGAKTEYSYTASKRLRSVTQYDPAARTTTLRFDAVGNLVAIEDPAGGIVLVRFDEANRVYELGHSGGAAPIGFARDLAGRVTAMTDRNGLVTTYVYDPLGRLVRLVEPDWPAAAPANAGKTVEVAYDPLGKRLRVSDSEAPGDFVYRYDPLGNLISRQAPDGSTLRYEYDARNELVRLHDGVGIVDCAFARDGDGRLLELTDSSHFDPSRTFAFHRSAGALLDNLFGIDYDASGLETRFEYDPNRQLTLAKHALGGAPLAGFGYEYRADGLLGEENGTRTASYDYDDRKQLVAEGGPDRRDGYDAAGNRLFSAEVPPPPAGQAVFDDQNRMVSDQEGTRFEYDANGNLLERIPAAVGGAPTAYTYDGANRLRVVEGGGTQVRYGYDADGRMVERVERYGSSTTTRRYRYANRSILAELDRHDDVVTLYTRDDEGRLLRRRSRDPLASPPSRDRHSLFVLSDGLGSVVRLVDWDGKVHAHREYDAWGQASGSAKAGRFGYRGAYSDPHTGLVNFGARWYDSRLGRWLSQDPLLAVLAGTGADMAPHHQELANLYRYVLNNPLGLWDPTGLNATLPRGWPPPPGWKGGFRWKDTGRDKLIDPDGNGWHWHPEDETHYEHWDNETRRGKRRLDRNGKDLGDDAFKPKKEPAKEPEEEQPAEEDDQTAQRVVEGGAAVGAGIGIGIVLWEVGKWTVAVLAAPETAGASLAAAAVTP